MSLWQTGTTPEDRRVIGGVGTLCFTHGVPLEVVLHYFKERNLVVDWTDYMMTALLDGHRGRTILSRMDSAVTDIYGRYHGGQVLERARIVLDWLTEEPKPVS